MGAVGTYGKVELQDELIDGLTVSIMEECLFCPTWNLMRENSVGLYSSMA
jgi:hypothetical protein